MKLETLLKANEVQTEIDKLKGELLVIAHVKRNDIQYNPPHYSLMGKDHSAYHYYVPKDIWVNFLNGEQTRIENELQLKQIEFENV